MMNNLTEFQKFIDHTKKNKGSYNRYIHLLVKKHENDVKKQAQNSFRYKFDINKTERVIQFFNKFIKHSDGVYANTPFVLSDWQMFIITLLFSWVDKKTGYRRYKRVYLEIARKNGKSTLLAALGLYTLVADKEQSAQIVSAATKRDQAKLLFETARKMVLKSPILRKQLKTTRADIQFERHFGTFNTLSSEANSLDGINPHCSLIDELHAHRSGEVYNVLDTALGSRTQPILISITTAGFNKQSFCYEIRDYATKILEKQIANETFLPVIFTLDRDDDWTDEKHFIKANPNLDISIKREYLIEQLEKAKQLNSAKHNFLTKHLNVWVDNTIQWTNTQLWQNCKNNHTLSDVLDCDNVYLGLDLSSTKDITSINVLGCNEDGKWLTYGKHFLPDSGIETMKITSNYPIEDWIEGGFLIRHPGQTINYNKIEREIRDILEKRPDAVLAYDAWNATQIIQKLDEEGYKVLTVRQGFFTLSPAMKLLETKYINGELKHNDDPVLSAAMYNLVAEEDASGNIKPSKSKAYDKIDPAVALIIACAATMQIEKTGKKEYTPQQREDALTRFLNDPIIYN